MSLADRLRYARERANLTGVQVRERAGIGESSLSEFEHGKREPNLSQLQALANTYRRSLAFFLGEGPVPPEVVLWREQPASSAEIEREFLRLCEQYHNLEVWCEQQPAGGLPDVKGDAAKFGYARSEQLAMRVRGELHLGDRPGQELFRVVEEVCGVKIFLREFEPTGTAASTKSETFGPGILLNSSNVRWRRNFDLAHELFHLLTWNIFRSEAERSSLVVPEKEESLATCFAGNLLMPAEPTRNAVDLRARNGKVSFEALFDIAREFDVSVESLLWRIHMLYNLGPEKEAATRKDIERAKALAPVLEERERAPSPPPKWPERYRALAVRALRRGDVSIGRFAEYLEISRQQAMSYVQQEAQGGEEVQIAAA